jgi:hypothetical protein
MMSLDLLTVSSMYVIVVELGVVNWCYKLVEGECYRSNSFQTCVFKSPIISINLRSTRNFMRVIKLFEG